MIHRRGFLSALAAVVAFPLTAVRSLAQGVRDRRDGWLIHRQQVGPFACSVRYRWLPDHNVDIDWYEAVAPRTPEAMALCFPSVNVDCDERRVSFSPDPSPALPFQTGYMDMVKHDGTLNLSWHKLRF